MLDCDDRRFSIAYLLHTTGHMLREISTSQWAPGDPIPELVARAMETVQLVTEDAQRLAKEIWNEAKDPEEKRPSHAAVSAIKALEDAIKRAKGETS